MKDDARLARITTLYAGAHIPNGQMCVMEAAAYVAGEPWSDAPSCVSPVIAAFLRRWNDDLPDDATRTRLLRPLILPLLGTRATAADESRRAWLLTDWLVRTLTPIFLRAVPTLAPHAVALGTLSPITDAGSAGVARPLLAAAWDTARDAARAAAWDTAWDTARDAARDAARAAARDAAWAAARAAALDPAWDTARAAARAAVSAAALDPAWAAARAAALDPAWDTARAAALAAVSAAAWDAAWDAARAAASAAARDALHAAVTEAQASAVALVLRMATLEASS